MGCSINRPNCMALDELCLIHCEAVFLLRLGIYTYVMYNLNMFSYNTM